jgi:hypothetical protein
MHGLRNLALAPDQTQRSGDALATCGRLAAGDDVITASAHRASACVNMVRCPCRGAQ